MEKFAGLQKKKHKALSAFYKAKTNLVKVADSIRDAIDDTDNSIQANDQAIKEAVEYTETLGNERKYLVKELDKTLDTANKIDGILN